MKLTVGQLKQLIREQIEEIGVSEAMNQKAADARAASGQETEEQAAARAILTKINQIGSGTVTAEKVKKAIDFQLQHYNTKTLESELSQLVTNKGENAKDVYLKLKSGEMKSGMLDKAKHFLNYGSFHEEIQQMVKEEVARQLRNKR